VDAKVRGVKPRRGNLQPEYAAGVGERIAQARLELGLSQRELGMRIGRSERSIQGYEAGYILPYGKLAELEQILQRPAKWFLYGDHAEDSADDGREELLLEMRQLLDELEAALEEVRAAVTRLAIAAER
jgi:transcriptional regulator with XRE-family HTH domain